MTKLCWKRVYFQDCPMNIAPKDKNKMPFTELLSRFALAATLTTACCVPLALVLLRVTGVPVSYPPLLPQQILAGSVGGALITALGYAFLSAILPNRQLRHLIFLSLAVVLVILSFYMPYRLSFTQSPRFAGVTPAAQVGQALLQVIVAGLSAICFITDESGWG
jgi:mannose/fructose/N-acetylgalactosamine-specific phosphotransferase system component IIC